mgnify:CR=1 FL=1
MTKAELVTAIAAKAGITKADAERSLSAFSDTIAGALPPQAIPWAVLGAVARSPRWELKRRLAEALPALIAGVERLADPDQDNVSLVVIKAGADARLARSPVRRHLGGRHLHRRVPRTDRFRL